MNTFIRSSTKRARITPSKLVLLNSQRANSKTTKDTSADLASQDEVIREEDSSHPPLSKNQSYHVRKGGNKPLPLSSFLDIQRQFQRYEARNRLHKLEAPRFEELDDFRKRFASNVYAQILAEPPRTCQLTLAKLPPSFLIKFHQVADPNPPHKATLMPVDLYNESLNPKDGKGRRLIHGRKNAMSIIARRDILSTLLDPAMIDTYPIPRSFTRPKNMMSVLDSLHREKLLRALSWHFKRGSSRELYSLPNGLQDLGSDTMTDVAVVLYFGPFPLSNKLKELDVNIESIAQSTDRLLMSAPKEIGLASVLLRRAVPRLMYPAVQWPTFDFKHSGSNLSCKVPIIMIQDIFSAAELASLWKASSPKKSKWIAVESSLSTRPAIKILLQSSQWFSSTQSQAREALSDRQS